MYAKDCVRIPRQKSRVRQDSQYDGASTLMRAMTKVGAGHAVPWM